MKLTANELRYRCIDGEKLRCVDWPRDIFLDYNTYKECIEAVNAHSRIYINCIENADKYEWEQVIEKKPFPFKEGEPILTQEEPGGYWEISVFNGSIEYYIVFKISIAPYSYKYYNTTEDIPGMIKAEDLHMYEVE